MVEMNILENEESYQNKAPPEKTPDPMDEPVRAHPPPKVHQDLMDKIMTTVNQDLLISKTFYFFFFSAFGSLFPLMGIFFKQLGMSPGQCGLLVGFRPFVEFLSAPFWGTIADQYRKGKVILLFSLVCWIAFTLSLAFVQPPAASCVIFNKTHYILTRPQTVSLIKKRSVDNSDQNDTFYEGEDVEDPTDVYNYDSWENSLSLRQKRDHESQHQLTPGYVLGRSPGPVHYTLNYDPKTHASYVKPIFSKVVYRREQVQRAFLLLLLLVVIGEFFAAPAITLADSVTLTYLGENANHYGRQRMFGSLGWGLSMFFVGVALDYSTAFPDHPCGPHENERNYTICFAVFSVLMGCAFITATQFHFDYDAIEDTIPMKSMPQENNIGGPYTQEQSQLPPTNPFHSEVEAYPSEVEGFPSSAENNPDITKTDKSKVFANTTTRIPEWLRVLRTFATLRYGAFLFVAWFMGFGIGLVFTFLFWHLQDLGGSPTLFGVASVINHISEIFAYFFSFRLIKRIGHVKVLCLGLAGNLARFLYISWLSNPWWVLPFELIQGITHAAVWAACCSYITQATPLTLRTSAQGVLQGLHHGLGRGCGAVFGGLIATYTGTAVTFRIYGFLCFFVLGGFIFINFYRSDIQAFTNTAEEPHQVLEDNYHLDPHGVPSSPMPRVLSSSRLEQMNGGTGQGTQGTHQTTAGFLDIPKAGGGGGGGGGGSGGGGGEWSQLGSSAMYTGSLQPAAARKSLANAFQLKDSPVSSPEAVFDYDFIRQDFQAYNDVLYGFCVKDDDSNGNAQQPLKAPLPMMSLHTPQPEQRHQDTAYEW